MASRQSPLSTPSLRGESLHDPFSDRTPQIHFDEPDPLSLGHRPIPRPYDTSTNLHDPAFDIHDDDEYIEKQPLNVGQGFTGGFYPPA